MQLILALPGRKHVVLNADQSDYAHSIIDSVQNKLGVPRTCIYLQYLGKQVAQLNSCILGKTNRLLFGPH